jgi:hypothetical protein
VLQVRKLLSGDVAFYYRYTSSDGERVRIPIGTGITLSEARRQSHDLSRRYQSGERDLRDTLEAELRELRQRRDTAERAAEAAASQQRATLGALLTAYVGQLRRDDKPSARSVERALILNVAVAWPKLWATPAEQISTYDLLAVIARLANARKLREAAKVRSYLRAAFAAAIRARQDARGLAALRELKITANPARDLVTIDGATNARERALSVAELRAYWKRIAAMPDPAGALLRFHLLTGGQRIEQLGRVMVDDFDADLKTVRLRDTKGRRKVARLHDVPLIPDAISASHAMRGGTLGPYLFTVTAGESGAVYATVQHRLREVVRAMAEAGELEKGAFTVGDLRRTVETRLAAAGVSIDVRAQLQSHGLGGIQARHYDRHDYLAEKRAALETLSWLLKGSPASVSTLPNRRRVKART